MTFNDINSRELIKQIQMRTALYNTKLVDYCNPKINEILWEEVSKAMNYPVSQCKMKWVNIRNSYSRYLRLIRRTGAIKGRKYYLADSLSFLLPFMSNRRRKYNSVLEQKSPLTPTSKVENAMDAIKAELNEEEEDNVMLVMDDFNSENDSNDYVEPDFSETSHLYNAQVPLRQSGEMPDQSSSADIKPRTASSIEQEHAFIDFARSLVLDYSQLSMKRQRTFKQRILSILNDLLDEQESEIC